jgi:hypothetical protein
MYIAISLRGMKKLKGYEVASAQKALESVK